MRLFALPGQSSPRRTHCFSSGDQLCPSWNFADFLTAKAKFAHFATLPTTMCASSKVFMMDPITAFTNKLCILLFLIATMRDHGARRVTVLVPFLCYGRKDRRTKPARPRHDKICPRTCSQR